MIAFGWPSCPIISSKTTQTRKLKFRDLIEDILIGLWGSRSSFYGCYEGSKLRSPLYIFLLPRFLWDNWDNYDIWRLFLQFMKFISVRLFPIREKKLSSFFCKTVKIYVNIQMCFVRRYFWPKVISLNLKFDFWGAWNLSQLVLFKIGRNSTSLHNEIDLLIYMMVKSSNHQYTKLFLKLILQLV